MAKISVLYSNLNHTSKHQRNSSNPETIEYVQFLISNLKNCAVLLFFGFSLVDKVSTKKCLHEKCNDEGVHTYICNRHRNL